jgi:uncharacterized protein (DUF433 family)
MSPDEIIDDFPELEPEDIHACLSALVIVSAKRPWL